MTDNNNNINNNINNNSSIESQNNNNFPSFLDPYPLPVPPLSENIIVDEVDTEPVSKKELSPDHKSNKFNSIFFSNSLITDLSASNLSNSTDKEEQVNVSIDDLLKNENLMTEIIYTYPNKYSGIFKNKINMFKLIDYSTHMPYMTDDEEITYKFPYKSTELLKSDAPYIHNSFFNHNSQVCIYFLQFLQNSNNNSNNLLCGYFSKIFISIFEKNPEKLCEILFNNSYEFINNMLELCNNFSICECIQIILVNENAAIKEKKIYILEGLFKYIYKQDYSYNICTNIIIFPLVNNNEVFMKFISENFNIFKKNILDQNNKNFKKYNEKIFEMFYYLIEFFKESISREKENEYIESRKTLDNYINENVENFIDFFQNLIIKLIDNNYFYYNNKEDKISSILKRIKLYCLDILVYYVKIIFLVKNEKYINNLTHIINENILYGLTYFSYDFPLFNLYHLSYLNLIESLSQIHFELLIKDKFFYIFLNYFTENKFIEDHNILISFSAKNLYSIYSNFLEFSNVPMPRELKLINETLICKLIKLYTSTLVFKEKKENNNFDFNINVDDEIDKKLNVVENQDFTNIEDLIGKGLNEYNRQISLIKFGVSSENIEEVIDIEMSESKINISNNENNKNKNNNGNNIEEDLDNGINEDNESDDSIKEIIKKTNETVKKMKEEEEEKEKNILNIKENENINNNNENDINNNKDDDNNNNKEEKNENKIKDDSKNDENDLKEEDKIEENIETEKSNDNLNDLNFNDNLEKKLDKEQENEEKIIEEKEDTVIIKEEKEPKKNNNEEKNNIQQKKSIKNNNVFKYDKEIIFDAHLKENNEEKDIQFPKIKKKPNLPINFLNNSTNFIQKINIDHVNDKEYMKRPSINDIILSHENINITNKDEKKKHKKLYLKKEDNNFINHNISQTEEHSEEKVDKIKNNNNIVLPIIKDNNNNHLNVSFEFKNKKLKPVIKATGLTGNNINNSLLTKSLNIHKDIKFWTKKDNFNNNIVNKDNIKK